MTYFFADPWALALLAAPLAYLAWYYGYYDRRRLAISLSYDPALFARAGRQRAWLRFVPQGLLLAAVALMILGLARPREAEGFRQTGTSARDIFLVFDVSKSMETPDMEPDRLTAARRVARQFVSRREDDRIGVIVFAQKAFTYVPLTLDRDFVRDQVSELTTGIMPNEGTALGPAIVTGVQRLRESEAAKIMVVVTDGAHNAGMPDPINAATLAAQYGIRIYAISVGREQYLEMLPFKGERVVETDLDEATLERAARITGGKFFKAADPKTLKTIFYYIDKEEQKRERQVVYKNIEERRQPFLIAAFACMLLAFGLKTLNLTNHLEG